MRGTDSPELQLECLAFLLRPLLEGFGPCPLESVKNLRSQEAGGFAALEARIRDGVGAVFMRDDPHLDVAFRRGSLGQIDILLTDANLRHDRILMEDLGNAVPRPANCTRNSGWSEVHHIRL